jgi:resuscitation-promoting factor RpfB
MCVDVRVPSPVPGKHEHWSTVRKQIAIVVAVALTVLGLVGGTVAYATMNKTVTLSIDGKVKEVTTFGDTVEDVLDSQDITIGERDAVAPSLSNSVEDGSRIAVRYGRELTLTVDGDPKTYWVTASNVDTALSQLGLRFGGADLSASRSAPIGREGLDLEINTAKKITVVIGKRRVVDTTTALTVREALQDLGVEFDRNDEMSPRINTEIADGSRIKLIRVDKTRRTIEVSIPNQTVVRENDAMYEGKVKVLREGRDGVKKVTYAVVLASGSVRDRTVVKELTISRPVNRVEVHGTKERAPEPSSSGANYASGNTVWDQLAECESGGNWAINTGNGYYGGLQFSLSTWQAYGGSGYPHENSRETQIMIAERVRDATGGYGSWPACAAELGLPT